MIREQSPEFSGLVLFAIPIAVFLVAFIVGWLIHRIGIINTIVLGVTLAIVSCVLQLFFTVNTPLWFIIIAFILLGSMWAMGNTVPIIAAQTAVGPARSSVATGTIVTMFNIGGSIGLAISIVVYHLTAVGNLKQTAEHFNFSQVEKLISNPAEVMKHLIDQNTHEIFNNAFMSGFTGVIWFLLSLSVLILLSIYIFNFAKK